MDHKDFDEILKDKLKGLESSSSITPDWERMERDLDSQKDKIFDEQVKRKLDQLTVSNFAPADWSTLYELITARIKRKRTVLTSKSLELSILLLLLFSFSQLGWFNEYKKDIHYADSFGTPLLNTKADQLQSPFNEKDISTSLVVEDENSETTKQVINNTISENTIIENTPLYSAAVVEKQSSTQASNFNKTLNSGGLITEDVFQDESLRKIFSSNSLTEENQGLLIQDVETSFLDNSIAFINPNTNNLERNLQLPLIPIDDESSSKSKFFVEAGADIAYASIESALRNSSIRNINNLENATNKLFPTFSISGGMNFDKGTVNTGLEYQTISYAPAVSHVSGELSSILKETEIESISYNVASVPLSVSWDFLKFKSWNFRVNTGFITNIITNVNIKANQTLTSGTRITYVDEGSIDYSNFPLAFNSGILDDTVVESPETSSSPFYFQSRTGLQIEKRINRNTSIISNLNYNYQLPISESPIQDKINSYSVGLSIRKYLG